MFTFSKKKFIVLSLLITLACIFLPSVKPIFADAAADSAALNPLGTLNITEVVGRVIKFLFGFAGSIALLMFVWGGFQFLWSAGDPNKVKKGKETLIYAAIGIGIMLASFVLVDAVITAISSGVTTH